MPSPLAEKAVQLAPSPRGFLMLAAIRDPNPVIFLEAKGLYGFFRTDLREEVPTLLSPRTDRDLARRELRESPLYRNLLMSPDGTTTALQVNFRRDETYNELLQRRNLLREKQLGKDLSPEEQRELAEKAKRAEELQRKETEKRLYYSNILLASRHMERQRFDLAPRLDGHRDIGSERTGLEPPRLQRIEGGRPLLGHSA